MTRSNAIATLLLIILTGLTAGSALAAPRPVVLELFTSTGCSSCPPAEALLRELQQSPPQDDVELIVLSQHVDYWNSLGWVDQHSDPQFTARQRTYAREVFGSGRVYTPQLVVNGEREMVGSREGEVLAAIRASAAQPAQVSVSLKLNTGGDRSVGVDVTVDAGSGARSGTAQVWLALTEDNVVSEIGAGENRGRRLHEDGVVRVLQPVGVLSGSDRQPKVYSAHLPLPANASPSDLNVVAFVQRRDSHVIAGAARQPLANAARQAAR